MSAKTRDGERRQPGPGGSAIGLRFRARRRQLAEEPRDRSRVLGLSLAGVEAEATRGPGTRVRRTVVIRAARHGSWGRGAQEEAGEGGLEVDRK